ncbi:ECF transporter S component [Latilactobacillus curvatus]|uniref:ECF transporter S component n=1 Tax=Latilactobacillus curvatus TaxID=28038 RepID=UPI000FECAE7A|nr:ECF transporter S component [Latilactobacillus curvatus]QAR34630.1 ECF transporter S component [Latilactobacillus curvatus]
MKRIFDFNSMISRMSTKTLVLIPIAVGINLIGGTLCSTLKLPLFLDMIGTIIIACLAGPWSAATSGILTNVFLAVVANPIYLPYAAVSFLCSLVVGYFAKWGAFRSKIGIILTWLACALTNTISATLVTVYVYGGASGVNSTSVVTVALLATTKKLFVSVLSSAMIENLIDKGIVFIIAFLIINKIPKHFLNQYSSNLN